MEHLCTPVYDIRFAVSRNDAVYFMWVSREEIIGAWRIMHDEELRKLYSPNIVQVFKSRSMRWPGQWPVWRRG